MEKQPNSKYIDRELISELVYHNEKYVIEFAQATEQSFTEFRDQYRRFLLERDEANLRKAGHKIKPVAQMLKIDDVVEEYEYAKTLLWENQEQGKLEESADKISSICDTIIKELEAIAEIQ